MFLSPLLKEPAGYEMRNPREGTSIATSVELAGDSKTRRKGLLGRDRMEPGSALVIAPCGGIHMFGMRFAIDVLFVKKDGLVVKCVHSIKPWRIAVALSAYAAIELPAGTIEATSTRVGDRVEVVARAIPASHG